MFLVVSAPEDSKKHVVYDAFCSFQFLGSGGDLQKHACLPPSAPEGSKKCVFYDAFCIFSFYAVERTFKHLRVFGSFGP